MNNDQPQPKLTLDHLVILVKDLDRAVAEYQSRGFLVMAGGTHADGLTHNALIVFQDGTYLELIAFLDPDHTQDNVWGWRRFLASGGGLIDYCMASANLAADVAAFQAAGLTVSGPTEGGRRRPDGTELRWRSAHFWQAGRELPFLIEDITPRELRVPIGPAAEHPNGALGIRELTIAVADLERIKTMFGTLLGSLEPQYGMDHRHDAHTATFDIDTTKLTLAKPMMLQSPVQYHMEALGLGPWQATLETNSGGARLLVPLR